jgi:hypothetical protein
VVASAIVAQIETISGDPSLKVELVTVMKYPFRPVNPRVISTPNLNVSTLSTELLNTDARVCNDSFGSDCGQYWDFFWWMGNSCENPSGTYVVRWDVVCRNNEQCLPFFGWNGGPIVMNNLTSTLTVQFSISTTADYCGGRVIDVPVGYEMRTYSDSAFTVPASSFMQCRYMYLAINNVDGPAPDSMTIDLFQISGGEYLIRNGTTQFSDVTVNYNGPNAQVSFQITRDRFVVPRNGALSVQLFASLELFYRKRTPTTSLLTGSSNISNCGGYCVSDRCEGCGNGIVDSGEACDGGVCCNATCQFRSSQYICRSASGACDVAETCSGSSSACPPDSTVCPTQSATSGPATEESSSPKSDPCLMVMTLLLAVVSRSLLF